MTKSDIFHKFLQHRRREQLSAEDLRALEDTVIEVRQLPPRHVFIRAGEPIQNSTYLIDGFISRYMDDREGLRQLVALHVAGDFVDLHAFPLKRLDHDVATITPCRVAIVPHPRIERILETRAGLSRLLWFSTLIDAAMHREWIFRLGRLNALGRVGHFFCELEAKLRAVGMSDGHRFEAPLTQTDLGEACGITPVHVNRMLRELREGGLLQVRGNSVEILNRKKLERLCEFDPAYLFLDFDPARNG